jgi:hypothetical protein
MVVSLQGQVVAPRLAARVLTAALGTHGWQVVGSIGAAGLLAAAVWPATALGPARAQGRWFAGGNVLLVSLFLTAEAALPLVATTAGLFLITTCPGKFLPRRRPPSGRPTWSTFLLVVTGAWLLGCQPPSGWLACWQTVPRFLVAAGLIGASALLSLGTRAVCR